MNNQQAITQHLVAAAAQYIPQNMKTPAVPILAKNLDKTTCPASPEDVQYMRRLPYRNLLGMCGYACLGTRPDACYAYKTLASFANCYGKDHWHALLQFILYLYSTRKTHVLRFTKSGGRDLNGYSDADWNGTWNMKSTSGWILFLGSSPISWCSRTQKNVTKSVGESEYVSLSELCQEAVHQRMLVARLEAHCAGHDALAAAHHLRQPHLRKARRVALGHFGLRCLRHMTCYGRRST